MRSRFVPDRSFSAYTDVTPAFLHSEGVTALLLDIDNTLAPYEVAEPDDALRAWFAALSAAGIRMAFVSNNNKERVTLFNRTLGLPAFSRARKPLCGGLRRALAVLEATPEEAALLGDQIFTDAYAAKRMGMRAYTVPPIRDKRDPFTRFKRLLERPVYRAYRKREARKGNKEYE